MATAAAVLARALALPQELTRAWEDAPGLPLGRLPRGESIGLPPLPPPPLPFRTWRAKPSTGVKGAGEVERLRATLRAAAPAAPAVPAVEPAADSTKCRELPVPPPVAINEARRLWIGDIPPGGERLCCAGLLKEQRRRNAGPGWSSGVPGEAAVAAAAVAAEAAAAVTALPSAATTAASFSSNVSGGSAHMLTAPLMSMYMESAWSPCSKTISLRVNDCSRSRAHSSRPTDAAAPVLPAPPNSAKRRGWAAHSHPHASCTCAGVRDEGGRRSVASAAISCDERWMEPAPPSPAWPDARPAPPTPFAVAPAWSCDPSTAAAAATGELAAWLLVPPPAAEDGRRAWCGSWSADGRATGVDGCILLCC